MGNVLYSVFTLKSVEFFLFKGGYFSSHWWSKTKQMMIPLDWLNLLFPQTIVPLNSSPVICKHVPFQATSLQNDEVRRSEWRSWFINLMCCFLTPTFPWPRYLSTAIFSVTYCVDVTVSIVHVSKDTSVGATPHFMLLVFKMINKHEANQDHRPLFRHTVVSLTSSPVNCKHA